MVGGAPGEIGAGVTGKGAAVTLGFGFHPVSITPRPHAMKISSTLALAAFFVGTVCAHADDLTVEHLATCRESWFDAKGDPVRIKALGDAIRAEFSPKQGDVYLSPVADKLVLGLPVTQLYPQSVGMGVGFSVAVKADFASTRAALEKALGKKIAKCEKGDGMLSCELQIAEKRTVMLISAESGTEKNTLFGCYYFYEK
jgi:hypothetical protein